MIDFECFIFINSPNNMKRNRNEISKNQSDSKNQQDSNHKKIRVSSENNGIKLWKQLNSVEGDSWVSATGIRNYLLGDPILDWLDKYYVDLGFNDGTIITDDMKRDMKETVKKEREKLNILFDNGNIFEKSVLDELQRKYPNDMVIVGKNFQDVTRTNFEKTVEYMKKGIPIIAQGILFNDKNNTRGMADLLVRSDFINKIFGTDIISDEELISIATHYRVIDIKWTTLQLCANGKLIRNGDKIAAYKGQLAIYNCALGNAQNYYPTKAYILGHAWKYEKCGDKFHGNSCFDLLGEIDYAGFDKDFIEKTAEAIRWIRNVRENGGKWTIIPPTVSELYPNMSNDKDTPWGKIKEKISKEIDELTQLWMVGPKNRIKGHKNRIFSWSQSGCNAKSLGIEGKKIGPVLNKIIQINQSKDKILEPDIILNNDFDWQNSTHLNFFVDFETVNGCFMKKPTNIYNNHSENNIIFLIGMGFGENKTLDKNSGWKFSNFKMKHLNIESEEHIIDAWMAKIDLEIDSYKKDYDEEELIPRIFHWGNAEVTSINLANRRHGNKWNKWLNKIIWIDLCKIFQNEPIVVKGAFRFKLKDIAKNMYKLKLIESTWDETNGINDGFTAMVDAIEYYKNTDENSMNMINIESYNETDCKVMWEMIHFLRKRNKN